LDKLWAPWRITYVSATRASTCIFCRAFKEKKDKKNFVIARSRHSFAILNTFPYNNGHVMIVSNRHVPSIEKLKDEEILDINKVLIKILAALKSVLKPAGFNVGINLGKVAGAGIDKHVHIHVVPRWLGDTNFMPVLTNTKIISQSLDELYKKITKRISKVK